jgi:hypothetical protein
MRRMLVDAMNEVRGKSHSATQHWLCSEAPGPWIRFWCVCTRTALPLAAAIRTLRPCLALPACNLCVGGAINPGVCQAAPEGSNIGHAPASRARHARGSLEGRVDQV